MGAPGIHTEKIKYDKQFLLLREILLLLKFFVFQEIFYSIVQFMNTEEENNRQEEMTTPTPEVYLVVELNSDVLRTLHSL